ncbi:MAG TPA: lytic transglycosylase domain-containing protein [Rhizomicrobium sp.]|nr:lytic transglycosylase domain-containing protein [Rhizomicrobium sp.]
MSIRKWLMAAVTAAALTSVSNSTSAADIAGGEAGFSPRVLSPSDVRLYREIFADEEAGRFAAAKDRLAEVSDRSLVGYVEAAHLLSPKARHVPLKQLTAWLAEYDDLPVAARVRELAENKNAKLRRRHRVAIESLPVVHHRGGGYEDTDIPDTLSSDVARAAQTQIRASVHAGQPQQAEATLDTLIAAGTAPGSDIAHLSHRVAASYMAEGQDDAAVRVASAVTGPDRAAQPLLDWDEGLANYRLGRYQESAQHFEMLAQAGSVPNYTRSAGAFWAARAHLAAGDPLRVITLLTAATREQPTFYGLLAEKILGQQSQTTFSDPVLDQQSFDAMMQIPAAHRAVALWQVGQREDLAGEMDRTLTAIDLRQGEAYAALARKLDLPNLELRACETAASRGVMLTGLFPVPQYAPTSGYHVDPSLVLAFTRAESHFRTNAVSNVGARGLMQLMPETAREMDGAASEKRLEDPSYNLDLGQRYLSDLLSQLNGNLIELAAAYNAGPGAVTRWVGTRGSMMQDPLLFIESMPSWATRDYVKRVLTYYWMYARRTGERSPTLDDTALGKWPKYSGYATQDAPPAQNVVVSDAATSY